MRNLSLILILTLAIGILADETICNEKPLFPENLNNNQHYRIFNGNYASRGQFPWHVRVFSVINPSYMGICGGSLIHPRWVLSAAHCLLGAHTIEITLGSVDLSITEIGTQVVITDKYICHENYDDSSTNNDIGLIDLTIEIGTTEFIRPISLPSRGNRVGVGVALETCGFGDTGSGNSSERLKWAKLSSISNFWCFFYYLQIPSPIIDSTLCATGQKKESPCAGDSGGGLVIRDLWGTTTLVGVNSFMSNIFGCTVGFPVACVRTESFLTWISTTTGILF